MIASRQNIIQVWLLNLALAGVYFGSSFALPYIQGSVLEYSGVQADPFDGAVMPVASVPDWLQSGYTNKAMNFVDFPLDAFVELPKYDADRLESGSADNSAILRERYTYPVVYMGSYRGNHVEYDGSHLAIDIRAPIGTPIRATANGVVVKSVNTDTANGRYVILRHDNVPFDGETATFYSSYLHMSEASATVGTAVKKGDLIGLVGMSGIATTPHVHFQIDRESAPYHTYWPFTFSEASANGLDFFAAINAGLGKESAMKYSVNPAEFIYGSLGGGDDSILAVIDPIPNVSASETPDANVSADDVFAPIEDSAGDSMEDFESHESHDSAPAESEVSIPDVDSVVGVIESEGVFSEDADSLALVPETAGYATSGTDFTTDTNPDSELYRQISYLYYRGIVQGDATRFIATIPSLSRRDAFTLLARVFSVSGTTSSAYRFSDVASNDPIVGPLSLAVERGYISANKTFRPNDTITRAEFVKLLVVFSGVPLSRPEVQDFADVPLSSPFAAHIHTFVELLGGIGGTSFNPGKAITRGDSFRLLYAYASRS
ncbi:MAG TPA: peptidoglycan DD-metalloendopeptidase family protein [bacterium]|nr:peptidoglycan DD-metalloendopeptidase family protein [bacterium]